MRQIFKSSRASYGSRRMMEQLDKDGFSIGSFKTRRLMRELGLEAKALIRYKGDHRQPSFVCGTGERAQLPV